MWPQKPRQCSYRHIFLCASVSHVYFFKMLPVLKKSQGAQENYGLLLHVAHLTLQLALGGLSGLPFKERFHFLFLLSDILTRFVFASIPNLAPETQAFSFAEMILPVCEISRVWLTLAYVCTEPRLWSINTC